MSVQKYPWLVAIYKGEGRLLIIPVVRHIGGYSIDSEWYMTIDNMEDYAALGDAILMALGVIEKSPISSSTPKEREEKAAWRKNSKYKGWISFWKNNYLANFKKLETGEIKVYSTKRFEGHKGVYNGCIKEISFPSLPTAEEIGRAVMEVFEAAEEFYEKK